VSLIILEADKIGDSPYEIGTTNALRCQVPIWRDHTIGPRTEKMAIIIPRHRRGTWEGVTVATWCSGWICRMRRGLGAHTLFSPASLSLPPMRGAAIGRSPTILQNDSFCTRISNFVQSAIFQLLVFDKVRRWSLRKKGKKQKDFSFLLGTQSEARAGWPTRLRLVRATQWADFAVITFQLWSTITAIFSWVNNFAFNRYLRPKSWD